VTGGQFPRIERENFASNVAELTDALALEVRALP
jgi:hypothetical protein